MFDAKSLLDTILGGQTAQQATAAAQSAGSAVAGVVSQAEETLKGTAVGDALSGAKNFAEQNPTAHVLMHHLGRSFWLSRASGLRSVLGCSTHA